MAETNPIVENLTCSNGQLDGVFSWEIVPQAEKRWYSINVTMYYNTMYVVKQFRANSTGLDRASFEFEFTKKEREAIYNIVKSQNGILIRVGMVAYKDKDHKEQVESTFKSASVWASFPHSEVGPEAELWVAPESELNPPLSSLYIPGKTKIIGEMPKDKWVGKYGAEVVSAVITVGKESGDSPFTSDYITGANSFYVKGTVTDTRGISTTYEQLITPTVASIPQLLPCTNESSVIVSRWKRDNEDDEGESAVDGELMYIAVRRNYSKLMVGDQQGNFCKISFKAKATGSDKESDWITILDENAESDEVRIVVEKVAIGGSETVFDKTKTYTIQLEARDSLGNSNISTFKLPTEAVYMCRAGERNSIAFGGYVSQDNSFEVYQEATLHGGLVLKSESGDNYFKLTVDDEGKLTVTTVSAAQTFLLKRGNK